MDPRCDQRVKPIFFLRAFQAAVGPVELQGRLEEVHAAASKQVDRHSGVVDHAVAAEEGDLGGSRIELGLEEIRIADTDSLAGVEVNEGEIAENDQPVPPRLGSAHERELEGLENLAERQVEIDRLGGANDIRLTPGTGEPNVT